MLNDFSVGYRLKHNCLACSEELSLSNVIIDFEKEKIVRCSLCGSWNYLPRPLTERQIQVHNTYDYFDHEYFDKRRSITPKLRDRCIATFKHLTNEMAIEKLVNTPILDVGCDTGSFILCAADIFGIVPHGIDVASRAIEIASKNGVHAYCGRLEEAPPEMSGYPIITAIDVLEHVNNPESLLNEMYSRLASGGLVYIETPNPGSIIYTIGKFVSKFKLSFTRTPLHRIFPPQHLICFTQTALKNIAMQTGFSIKDYGTRSLPYHDLALVPPIAMGIVLCQMPDNITQQKILHWIVLKKPNVNDPI